MLLWEDAHSCVLYHYKCTTKSVNTIVQAPSGHTADATTTYHPPPKRRYWLIWIHTLFECHCDDDDSDGYGYTHFSRIVVMMTMMTTMQCNKHERNTTTICKCSVVYVTNVKLTRRCDDDVVADKSEVNTVISIMWCMRQIWSFTVISICDTLGRSAGGANSAATLLRKYGDPSRGW